MMTSRKEKRQGQRVWDQDEVRESDAKMYYKHVKVRTLTLKRL